VGSIERLAVVVPVFNEAAGIRPTLEALAAQRDADFDAVFVDNGSTDDSARIILDFAREHGLTRWRVIDEAQKGTGAAADTGMRAAIAAGATLLARTDADCLPREDWTAAVRRSLTTGGLGLVGGELVPRRDEGLSWATRALLRGAVHLAEAFGRIRPGQPRPGVSRPVHDGGGLQRRHHRRTVRGSGGIPAHRDRGPPRGPRSCQRRAPHHEPLRAPR
jgi:hypothetical protein